MAGPPLLHVGTYLLAGAFVVLNRSIPGIWLIAAGGFLNGITIALNDGTLPASAARAAGGRPAARTTHQFVNSGVVGGAHLPWLGDVFAWPQPLAAGQRVQRRRRPARGRRVLGDPPTGPAQPGRAAVALA